MKSAVAILAFALAIGSVASAEMHVIDLSKGFTWKAMFDAGFRPKYVWEGNFMCCQTGVEVGLRATADGEVLELGKGDIEFTLNEGHTLTKAIFYGRENITVQDARARTEVFARMFEGDVAQKAVLRELEIKEAPRSLTFPFGLPGVRKSVDVADAVNAARTKELRIIHSFSNLASRGNVKGRLSITLADQKARFRPRMTNPIQPPPGYEHISLVPERVERGGDANKGSPSRKPSPLFRWWWKIGVLLGGVLLLVILIRVVRR